MGGGKFCDEGDSGPSEILCGGRWGDRGDVTGTFWWGLCGGF